MLYTLLPFALLDAHPALRRSRAGISTIVNEYEFNQERDTLRNGKTVCFVAAYETALMPR